MSSKSKLIRRVLGKLNQLEYVDIVPTLKNSGQDQNEALDLVLFLKKNDYAEFNLDSNWQRLKPASETKPISLEKIFIKAKITPKGEEYLRSISGLKYSIQSNGWKILVGGILIILGLLITGIWNKTFENADSTTLDSINFTVFVHGPKGKNDRILKNEGQVELKLKSDSRREWINEKGEATFKEIPVFFKNKKVQIFIDHPQPYRVVYPDSLYLLKNNDAVYLEVNLFETDKITGIVIDGITEEPLDSVRVSVKRSSVFTNKFGEFFIVLPPDEQAKFQKIRFYKEGYGLRLIDSIPVHTKKEVNFSLTPKR